jgi:CubicO group peptidase (beta-lactamase class C family)
MKAFTAMAEKCLDTGPLVANASPANQMRRREFLIESSRAALGFSLLSLAGCSTVKQRSGSSRDIFLQSRIAEWERGIPQWLQDAKLPGVSMLLINDGKVFWQREFGVKDAVSKEPVDSETVFAACSNTKPVFAYAVAKLCEKGVMDLDTPLTKYTSKRFLEGDPRLDLITARHVLTHTTGFPNWRNDKEPLAIQFTPGTKRQYSGEGFHYLQSVVEEVTRQPFAEFMRVNILEPFGMMSSRFDWDETYARRIATPHDQNGKRIEKKPQTASETAAALAIYGAAARLFTTPSDYAKFILEILNPKPADAFRLNENSRREYLRPQFKSDEINSSSLGWLVFQLNGLTGFTHAGSDAGWNCDARASTDRKSGIIIMTNGDSFLPFFEKLKLDLEFFTHLFKA